MTYEICTMMDDNWEQVKSIYLEGINTGNATFQSSAPSWDEWNDGHISSCRLVARYGEDILGWGALSTISKRECYSGVAEVSIYIGEKYRGKGIGKKLLQNLIEESEENRFWTLQAGIFPENKASISLHKKFGFREVGVREKIGKMNCGIWRDVALLERRSKKIF